MLQRPDTRRIRREHLIKPNEKELMPHRMAVFAVTPTETDTPTGRDLSWGQATLVTWRNDTKGLNDPRWTTATEPLALWRALIDATGKRNRLWVFAHELGRHLRLADGLNLMPQLGFDIAKLYFDKDITRVDFTDGQRKMLLVDTHGYWPKPLAEIAESLRRPGTGNPRGRAPRLTVPSHDREETETVRQAITVTMDWWRDHNMGNWQASGAALGMAMFRHRFMTHKVVVHADSDALEAERGSMHAGWCEAWIKGHGLKGPWYHFDQQGSYPRIAMQTDLPVRLTGRAEGAPRVPMRVAHARARVLYLIDVECDVQAFPARVGGRIIWPVDTYRTYAWDREVEWGIQLGAAVTPVRFWTYQKAPVMWAWGEYVMNRLAAGPDGGPGPVPFLIKQISRATIGKWAANPPQHVPLYRSGDMRPSVEEAIDAATGDMGYVLNLGGITYQATRREESPDGFPAITSAIMAEGRIRLYRALQACPPGTVAHFDTDGIWVHADGLAAFQAHCAANPGHGWRIKAESKLLDVWGPQAVVDDHDRCVSGMPRSARRRADGTYEGEVWEGFLAAMRSQDGSKVRIRRQQWQPTRMDHRRNPDGTPIRVRHNVPLP